MRRLLRRTAAAVLLLIAIASGSAFIVLRAISMPGPLAQERAVVIPRGAGVDTISRLLAQAGIVRESWQVMLAARLRSANRQLRAGEFLFPAHVSAVDAIEILRSGQPIVRRFTVAEGLTAAQVIQLLERDPSLAGAVPPVPPEGSLLPETYHYTWGDQRADLVERMRSKMREALAELWARRSAATPVKTPEEAVVLASIVEKETSVPEERARIAGVFANRLAAGMRLQSDPTVVYAVTGGSGPLGRSITRADLRMDSPYNTYLVDGLPPGPIANPGLASLEAVLNPEPHQFLYFVADGNGGHAFARTLAEHNRNVARWRAAQRDQLQQTENPSD
ncbi:endolytic transglycosylase MltG [Arenibaculum pallidiluteum]|uniref:endolytic transglycosylase MltG n=1 Tax=Arenibaculum pallidiluteum TaxID=2812559 RepID=UPI001A96AE7F|nr:endolytic transglycosylase MltG [Arenibaculum pallidiluteum]